LLRARQKIGKYRILGRIASGPLADVYRAYDTIQKQRVALKMPKADAYSGQEEFLHEVQVATRLQHPNILRVLNACYIDDHFVIAMELGEESLADRIERRISTARALDLAGQAIAALAHAHEHSIIHCDIKPENYILFPGNQLKLCDFGFAKISLRTLKASGSGTIDYIAPEQAMGRPKFQSDVFSLGLVLYRLLSGKLPEWPFAWPMAGHERLTAKVRPELVEMLRKVAKPRPPAETLEVPWRPQGRHDMAPYAVARIPAALQVRPRHPAPVPALRGTRVRGHAGMPVVWFRQPGTEFGIVHAVELPAMRARRQERLGLLPMVLWARLCRGNDPSLPRQAILGPLQ
jgi:serine/threonine-protein kinase